VTTGGGLTAVAAKEVTADIPIIFASGGDPIQLGLVPSLSRPAGNVTGVSLFISELGTKRLDFLRQLVPAARKVGILANPNNPASGLEARDIQAHASGAEINARIFNSPSGAFEQAFAAMASENVQALVVANDPFLIDTRQALIQHAANRAIPTIYFTREFVDAGGLISYGASIGDAYHKVGSYVGQVLNGASPGDLPVQQPTKFELLLNLATAKTLGITIPPSLLARADEVIE
jgi:putative ABC transport system substrate-binding protein